MTSSEAGSAPITTVEASIDIEAPPSKVWELICDPRNMARWSPMVLKTFLRSDEVGHGAKFVNLNRQGLLVWPTRSKIVRYTPGVEMAFRVKDNQSIWSYKVAPTAGGSTLTAARETPQGISAVSQRLARTFFNGEAAFSSTLQQGLHSTLVRIKADAEA